MICQNKPPELFAPVEEESDEVGYCETADEEGVWSSAWPNLMGSAQLTPAGEIELLKMKIAAMEAELKDIKAALNRDQSRPHSREDAPCLAEVVKLTQDMFGSVEIATERESDEIGESVVIFTVRPIGEPDELVKKRVEWHRKVRQIKPGDSGSLRLSIVPAE
jgi:hypothetical protein